jgi:hypothetical protein
MIWKIAIIALLIVVSACKTSSERQTGRSSAIASDLNECILDGTDYSVSNTAWLELAGLYVGYIHFSTGTVCFGIKIDRINGNNVEGRWIQGGRSGTVGYARNFESTISNGKFIFTTVFHIGWIYLETVHTVHINGPWTISVSGSNKHGKFRYSPSYVQKLDSKSKTLTQISKVNQKGEFPLTLDKGPKSANSSNDPAIEPTTTPACVTPAMRRSLLGRWDGQWHMQDQDGSFISGAIRLTFYPFDRDDQYGVEIVIERQPLSEPDVQTTYVSWAYIDECMLVVDNEDSRGQDRGWWNLNLFLDDNTAPRLYAKATSGLQNQWPTTIDLTWAPGNPKFKLPNQ